MPSDPSDRFDRDAGSDRTEFPLDEHGADPLGGGARDAVTGVDTEGFDDPPRVVSVSDVHGYLDAGRDALLAVEAHEEFPPVVTADGSGRLHWADENYVLVFNGDLIDRGPANPGTVALVARLLDEAPAGRVRVTLGNHEMAILTPDLFGWTSFYSCLLDPRDRRTFLGAIEAGHVVAAYEGHGVTYAHAGAPEPYDVAAANDELAAAADRLEDTVGGDADADVQAQLVEENPLVLGLGGVSGRGKGAGLAWLDFDHMPPDAPPQVVGHSRHDRLTAAGNVLCQNVIRNNLDGAGGEAVTVETPDRLLGLTRTADGGVREATFELG